MPRRDANQLGIRFSTTVNENGYEWIQTEPGSNVVQRLAPVGMYQLDGESTVNVLADTGFIITVFGQLESQRAMNAFKRLGDQLRPLEVVLQEAALNRWPFDRSAADAFMEEVKQFANRFGLLEGEDSHMTIDEWRKEIREFRDLWDLGAALRASDFTETERRFYDDSWGLWYKATNNKLRVASPDNVHLTKGEENDEWISQSNYEDAMKSPRSRANMAFTKWMNQKLKGGLSMRCSMIEEETPIVTPVHLKHMLYAKLLIKTRKFESEIRGANCLECDRPIRGTKRRKFCDDQCRTRFHNRRRAAQTHT